MHAVWSFWTAPYRARKGFGWKHERFHCLSWLLSVGLAQRHFDSLSLHTDDAGAGLLVDQLGLGFDKLSLSLNSLDSADPDWWIQGKLLTYAEQEKPFVHIDCDVYLFKPLPERLTSAAVLAQNPETIEPLSPWYDAEACETAIRNCGDGHIPPEWTKYRAAPEQLAACCGIFGGHSLDFIRDYSSSVLRILQAPGNRHAFDHLNTKRQLNPLFEQYLLAAWAEYHGVRIEYLFSSFDNAFLEAEDAGFTHLMAEAKLDGGLAARIEKRVAREWPEAYERCQALFFNRVDGTVPLTLHERGSLV